MPFPPPYQRKDITAQEPFPLKFDNDVDYWGDWTEGIRPFHSIEWIRVRPRYLKARGRLIAPATVDESDQFLSIIERMKIPYTIDGDTVTLYGFLKAGMKKAANKAVKVQNPAAGF